MDFASLSQDDDDFHQKNKTQKIPTGATKKTKTKTTRESKGRFPPRAQHRNDVQMDVVEKRKRSRVIEGSHVVPTRPDAAGDVEGVSLIRLMMSPLPLGMERKQLDSLRFTEDGGLNSVVVVCARVAVVPGCRHSVVGESMQMDACVLLRRL
ncbi:hypothetical protein CEXT_569701 [Caerostris extrusa]|uniref:Uncharacterized protein n=1 Tax=Caerostris extrusa TaxID=172846 RepID=A0AAV4XVD5_CAEEX|nr:hypothetical protein CEXT_569701 [Caerostris extrusa]